MFIYNRYVLKTDDDIIVNTFVVVRYLQQFDKIAANTSADLHGHILCNLQPQRRVRRNGKWHVSPKERPYPYWPPFCQGVAFIVTGSLIPEMYDISFYVPFLWLDDVFVTGFIPLYLGGQDIVKHVRISEAYVKKKIGLIERMLEASRISYDEMKISGAFAHIQDMKFVADVWTSLDNFEKQRKSASDSHVKTTAAIISSL